MYVGFPARTPFFFVKVIRRLDGSGLLFKAICDENTPSVETREGDSCTVVIFVHTPGEVCFSTVA